MLHRMNDLIMSRHISPQLFVSHLQDSANVYMSKVEKIRQAGRKCVEYRDRIRELERENSLLRVQNSDLVHQLQGMYDESRLALEQKWNMEFVTIPSPFLYFVFCQNLSPPFYTKPKSKFLLEGKLVFPLTKGSILGYYPPPVPRMPPTPRARNARRRRGREDLRAVREIGDVPLRERRARDLFEHGAIAQP